MDSHKCEASDSAKEKRTTIVRCFHCFKEICNDCDKCGCDERAKHTSKKREREIDVDFCKDLHERVTKALRSVSDEMGVDVSVGYGKYTQNTAGLTLSFVRRTFRNGNPCSKGENEWNGRCAIYGLNESHYGQEIVLQNGTKATLAGIKARKSKLQIVVRTEDGKESSCSSSNLRFESKQGRIYLNDQLFNMKGITHFGVEDHLVVDGLYSLSMDSILNNIANNNFNVIRFPFAAETILLNTPPIPDEDEIDFGLNPDLRNLNVLQIMDIYIQKAAQRGILIMLGMHRLHLNGPIDTYWYDGTVSEAQMIEAWRRLFQRYRNQWNVFGADLKNEPHDTASWGSGNMATDWRLAAERIILQLSIVDPNMLFFVEGVELNAVGCTDSSYFWGEAVCGAAIAPVRLSDPMRLVYCPHVYGITVSENEPYFSVANFPNNMPAVWDRHFGFLPNSTGRALIIGEWGGFYAQTKQKQWTDAFVDYLIARGLRDNVFFSVSPTSDDTDGIYLSDWRTPYTAVLNFLSRLQPNPTKVNSTGINSPTIPSSNIATSVVTTGVATTRVATTGIVTTSTVTTGIATTKAATTIPSSNIATSVVTTGVATTRAATTGIVTTSAVTTGVGTTGIATTGITSTDGTSQVQVSIRKVDRWTDCGKITKQYDLRVTNLHPSKILLFVQLESNNMNPIHKWNMAIRTIVTFPDWLIGVGLNPGNSWDSSFIIGQRVTPQFNVTIAQFI